MNYLRSLSVLIAFAPVLLAAGLVDATVRKCATTRSGVSVILGAPPVIVLNGQNLGPVHMPSKAESALQINDATFDHIVVNEQLLIPNADIIDVQVTCMEFTEGDTVVGRQVIAIVTKSGAVEFMRSHLQALSALQEEHRASNDTYAVNLSDLGFFTSRAPLPIELTARQDSWSARIEIEGFGTSCSIQGGQQNNVVSCGS